MPSKKWVSVLKNYTLATGIVSNGDDDDADNNNIQLLMTLLYQKFLSHLENL